jgi:prepilin-type N-terminal cleavage/methylation domain-containing protein
MQTNLSFDIISDSPVCGVDEQHEELASHCITQLNEIKNAITLIGGKAESAAEFAPDENQKTMRSPINLRSNSCMSNFFPIFGAFICGPAMIPGKSFSEPNVRMRKAGFSLVEMLMVLAITGILSSLIMASFSSIIGGSFDQTISDMSETMEQARSYAMANNTYVYVGIQEVDASSTATPAAAGNGLIAVAVVASKDGTDGFNGAPTTTTWTTGSSNLVAISKLKLFRNVHLPTTEVANSGNLLRPVSASNPAYYIGTASLTSTTPFSWPLNAATPTYNFTKVIRFGPQGDANILQSATTATVDWLELDLQPIHGDAVTSVSSANVSAIQVDGMTGTVRSYRP